MAMPASGLHSGGLQVAANDSQGHLTGALSSAPSRQIHCRAIKRPLGMQL